MAISYPNMNSSMLLQSARANFQKGRFERVASAMRILLARNNLTNIQRLQLKNLARRANAYASKHL